MRPIQKDLSLEVSNAIKVRNCYVFHFCQREFKRWSKGRREEGRHAPFQNSHTLIKHTMYVKGEYHIYMYTLSFIFCLTFKEDSPLVNCVNCDLIIPMAQVRKHELECGGGSSQQPSNQIERYVSYMHMLYTFKHLQCK